MAVNTVGDIQVNLLRSLPKSEIESLGKMMCGKLTNDSDRVKIITDILKLNGLLPCKKVKLNGLLPCKKVLSNKSSEKSIELRNLGNKAFGKNNREALRLYTESIAVAPYPTEVELTKSEVTCDALAIAFANRSAVLFSMGKYEICLKDISQLLKFGYPEKLLYKIYERQGKCLQYLGRKNEALDSVNNALKWLPSAIGLTEDKQKKLKIELLKLLKTIENSKTSIERLSHKLSKLSVCSYDNDHQMPSASDCVEIKYFPEMGRGITATRDIQLGDVIMVEKRFASFLSPKNFHTHCYNCLQRSETLLPCCFCSNVMYCSEDCRSSSWNDNHFIDCSLLPTLQRLDITEVSFLVMKIIIMLCKNKDFNNILASVRAEENLQNRDLSNKNLNSSDYSPIYWMECHSEKRDFYNLLKRSVTAACILHCLETMTDFFSGHDVSQFKYMLGGLLLRHLQNLTSTAFGVNEMVKSNAEIDELLNWEPGHIGAAVYVTLCLMNHSCNPNVSQTYFDGDSAKLYALRPVAAGEQLYISYGPHYLKCGKAERASEIKSQFYFTCNCVACVEDWPPMNSLPMTSPTFICNRCKHVLPLPHTTCISCKITHNVQTLFSKIRASSAEFKKHHMQVALKKNDTNWNELAKKIACHLKLLDEHVKLPWFEYAYCQETLKECMSMTGNVFRQ